MNTQIQAKAIKSMQAATLHHFARSAAFILLGILLLAGAAQLVIPLEPVPLTFQSSAVILLGMLYGRRLGTLTAIGYLLVGGVGLPIFAGMASGFSVFTGATAGYLFGFIPAIWLAGMFVENRYAKGIISTFLCASLAASIIFICGVMVLSQFVGFKQAILVGVAPFVFTELAKLFVVSIAISYWQKNSAKHSA